ncbi:MAG: xanthine dehydrogenase family protein subunit M [Anaerolineales bacterium]|nr:xanthine dehydrogenase family protein subunit M [Anaerolineales bacterium]
MYPPKFEYHKAGSVDEAVALIGAHGGKFLAGGHSLIPVMKMRLADPETLVDIGGIAGLKGISNNGRIHIGALTTHAMVAAADGLPAALPEAAGMIGDPQVRNRGTVGGNVAHADPASDLPTVFLALKATFHVAGANGTRTVAADDFFVDLFATALDEGEILTAVSIPAETSGTGSAYAKLFNPASRYAMVGAAVQLSVDAGGTCTAASVAVGGLTPKATRAGSVEAALVGKRLDADTLAAAAAALSGDLGDDVMGDIHASASYRRQVAPALLRRALESAAARAR